MTAWAMITPEYGYHQVVLQQVFWRAPFDAPTLLERRPPAAQYHASSFSPCVHFWGNKRLPKQECGSRIDDTTPKIAVIPAALIPDAIGQGVGVGTSIGSGGVAPMAVATSEVVIVGVFRAADSP
ncbi:hypothetical protein FRB94_007320 [Tulasnella sp. JGI-2019a]|nr:hypothetical protein FRB94_007320 [Tulasnella sp. JGI-2019a]KAG9024807.1 hypothetical protein FRB95_011046 [Tulasnella sp. JGI-2019a]